MKKLSLEQLRNEQWGADKIAYSRSESAALLGISEPSLDRLVGRGLLRPNRSLRRPLFSRVELERFLDENR